MGTIKALNVDKLARNIGSRHLAGSNSEAESPQKRQLNKCLDSLAKIAHDRFQPTIGDFMDFIGALQQ